MLLKFLLLWFMKVLYKHRLPIRAVRLMAQLLLQLPNPRQIRTQQNILVAEV